MVFIDFNLQKCLLNIRYNADFSIRNLIKISCSNSNIQGPEYKTSFGEGSLSTCAEVSNTVSTLVVPLFWQTTAR